MTRDDDSSYVLHLLDDVGEATRAIVTIQQSIEGGVRSVSVVVTCPRGLRGQNGTIQCETVPLIHRRAAAHVWDAIAKLLEAETDREGRLLVPRRQLFVDPPAWAQPPVQRPG